MQIWACINLKIKKEGGKRVRPALQAAQDYRPAMRKNIYIIFFIGYVYKEK